MDNLSAKNVANFSKVYEIRSSKIKYTQGSQWNFGTFKKLLCIWMNFYLGGYSNCKPYQNTHCE